MNNHSNKTSRRGAKFYVFRFLRNFLITFAILSPAIWFLLGSDIAMALAPMDKKPWVHWNGLDPRNEVYITWETEDPSTSLIEYGTDASNLNHTLSNATEITLHRFRLSGLMPNTKYYYRVSNDLGDTWYASGSFATAPDAENPTDFTFALVSDTQNWMGTGHYPRIARVLSTLTDLSFVAYAGDMTEDHGQFSLLHPDEDQMTWNQFWQNTNQFTATTPMVPDPGNHDDSNEPFEVNKYQHYFGISTSPNHNYYSFNWSKTQFVMAQVADGGDEQRNDNPILPTYQQDIWLNETLAAGQSMDFRIVVFHRSLFASGGNDQPLIDRFMPILTHYNVSILFYGHDHGYERFYIQNRTIVCLGSDGAFMGAVVRYQEGIQASVMGPSFTTVSCDSTGISLLSYTPTLNQIDSMRLNKVGSTVVPAVISTGDWVN